MYRKKGNDNWRSKVLTYAGYLEMSWRTSDREIARAAEAMWKAIAKKREWDLLKPVIVGSLPVLTLYDRYKAARGDLNVLKAQSTVINLATKIKDFLEAYNARDDVKADSKDRVKRHVEHLVAQLPVLLAEEMQDPDMPDSERPADMLPTLSNATSARLAKLLDRIKSHRPKRGKIGRQLISSSTRRVVHSSWSVFFDWLRLQYPKLVSVNPMEAVKRPSPNKVLPRFYRLPQVRQLIAAAPNEEIADIWTFMYGTGAGEITSVLRITSEDASYQLDDKGESVLMVRVPAEKAEDRDRMCHVAAWARPAVEKRIRMSEPGQPIWSYRDRSYVSHAHTKAVRELGLPDYPMYNARHHWAVTWLEAGAPVEYVQRQLGHSSQDITFEKYGRFQPKGGEYARWEQKAVIPHLELQDEQNAAALKLKK